MDSIRIPLLRDRHSHPLVYAAFELGVSLEAVTRKEAALELLRAATPSKSGLVLAHGWRSNRFDWTTEELESFPPLAIFNVSLHDLKLNTAGLQLLESVYGPVVQRVADRIWYEHNMRVVLNWFANLTATEGSLLAFFAGLREHGVAYAEEMLLVDEREIELFQQCDLTQRTQFWASPETFESLSAGARQAVTGIKLFTDGAIGARTAALVKPYLPNSDLPNSDLPTGTPEVQQAVGRRGLLLYSDVGLAQELARASGLSKRISIHAIGDRAIEQVIRGFERDSQLRSEFDEVRIEHAQLIELELARRAKQLGVTLCMQPNFNSDSNEYRDRLPAEYCELNNPLRMLIDEVGFVAGEDLIFGSDGMPHGIEAAARQSLATEHAWQRLSIDEFVAGYCMPDFADGCIELTFAQDQLESIEVLVDGK